jgi:hypothetical protein
MNPYRPTNVKAHLAAEASWLRRVAPDAKPPTHTALRKHLEESRAAILRDIAALEARGVHVDRSTRRPLPERR